MRQLAWGMLLALVAAVLPAAPVAAQDAPMELTVRVTTEGAGAPARAAYEVTVRCEPEGGATLRFTGPGNDVFKTSADSCVIETDFPDGSTGITYRCRAASPATCTSAVNVVERASGASGGTATVTVVYEYPDTTTTTAAGATSSTSTVTSSEGSVTSSSTATSSSSSTSTTEEETSTTEQAAAPPQDDEDDEDDDSDTGLLAVALIALAAVLAAGGMFIARRRRGRELDRPVAANDGTPGADGTA